MNASTLALLVIALMMYAGRLLGWKATTQRRHSEKQAPSIPPTGFELQSSDTLTPCRPLLDRPHPVSRPLRLWPVPSRENKLLKSVMESPRTFWKLKWGIHRRMVRLPRATLLTALQPLAHSKTHLFRVGFGRKMFTDYEIVCRVCLSCASVNKTMDRTLISLGIYFSVDQYPCIQAEAVISPQTVQRFWMVPRRAWTRIHARQYPSFAWQGVYQSFCWWCDWATPWRSGEIFTNVSIYHHTERSVYM